MRLTCLKCGHQIDIATGGGGARVNCVCGQDYSCPNVVNTGVCPSERAAERSRSRAFKAAGIVKDWGSFALGVSLLGILFPLIALIGAGIGIYVLTMVRGPLGRYSGRKWAAAAVMAGAVIFVGEGALALRWLDAKRQQEMKSLRAGVAEDLRALLRAERLFRATQDTYGTLRELGFRPTAGRYSIYLGPDDFVAARRGGESIVDPLPPAYAPVVTESTFTAVAVANLDSDDHLDVWLLHDDGRIVHASDDASDEVLVPPAEKERPAGPEAAAVPAGQDAPVEAGAPAEQSGTAAARALPAEESAAPVEPAPTAGAAVPR